MQSDTDRKGIRSTRRPRLDVDIGPESNDLAVVQRSEDARGVEGVNMIPEITNGHSKPTCRIVVARTEFTGKQALLYAPPHSGNHQWRVLIAGTGRGLLLGRGIFFGRPPWNGTAGSTDRRRLLAWTSPPNMAPCL